MNATKAFADYGLKSFLDAYADFEFRGGEGLEPGSLVRLDWTADWENDRVEFRLKPLEMASLAKDAVWSGRISEVFVYDRRDGTPMSVSGMLTSFYEAFPDRVERDVYLNPIVPTR